MHATAFSPLCVYRTIFVTMLNHFRHKNVIYEGDPRSNANPSVISFKFAIIKNGLPVYYDILSILLNQITFSIYHIATPVA